ncbi:hypothetical protein GCM10010206_40540 [Streptomyces cinerochromogenes]|nr:hypothetical protein GCM10010206_40540 [Streptomyces cinerochromogenes]
MAAAPGQGRTLQAPVVSRNGSRGTAGDARPAAGSGSPRRGRAPKESARRVTVPRGRPFFPTDPVLPAVTREDGDSINNRAKDRT